MSLAGSAAGSIATAEMTYFDFYPPVCQAQGWGLWFFDQRWRLPYRWYEVKVSRTCVVVMLFGAAIMVAKNNWLTEGRRATRGDLWAPRKEAS